MRYLDKLAESAAKQENLSRKQYRNMMTAVSRVKSVERKASGSEPSEAFIRGVKKGAKGEILRQHGRKRNQAMNKKELDVAHTSYQQIGDILAEAILGKIRSKVAGGLKKFSRKQYRKGEVDDASGKPKRAGMRGKAAHMAGKLAQKVEPKDEG